MGMPTNPYAAGNRVYKAGAKAPNTGAVVNKQGYTDRDIRQQAQQRAYADKYNKLYQNRGAR